jgi:hypothetical protein
MACTKLMPKRKKMNLSDFCYFEKDQTLSITLKEASKNTMIKVKVINQKTKKHPEFLLI